MDMTLPQFFLWLHVADKNMVEEAETLGLQVAQALAPMFAKIFNVN